MSLTSTGGAAILTPEQVEALVIRPLQADSVATQASTIINTASSSTRIPIVGADPTTGWVAEGAEISASDPTLAEIDVTVKKLAGLTAITNELAADSNPAAQSVVGEGLVRDLRAKLDAAFFAATTATNAPAGLGTLAGVSTIEAPAAFGNLDDFAEAIAAAETLGRTITSFVANPADALALSVLKDQTGSNRPLLQSDPTLPTRRLILGVPLLVSAAVTPGTVWAIPAAQSYVVIRTDASVVVDSSAFFSSDRLAVRATLRVGFAFPHAAAISKITLTA